MKSFVLTNFFVPNYEKIGTYFFNLSSGKYFSKKKIYHIKKENNLKIVVGYMYKDSYINIEKDGVPDYKIEDSIMKLEGKFSVVCLEDDKVDFFTDAFGLEKLFYYVKDNQFIISNSQKEIASLLYKNNMLNVSKDKLKDWLVYGHNFNDETIIENLMFVKPGAHYTFFNNILNVKSVFSLRDFYKESKGIQYKDKFDDFQNICMENISSYLSGRDVNVGCYLSSGLDSRTNAFFLDKLNKDFLGITYDCASEEDILSSLSYGALSKVSVLNCFMPKSKEKLKYFLDMASYFHCLTQPSENLQFFPNSELLSKNIDVIFDGTSADIFMGGKYKKNLNLQKEISKVKFGPLSNLDYNNPYVDEFFNLSGLEEYEKVLLYNLEHRQRYWIIPGLDALYSFAEPFSTTYNKKLVQFLFSLSSSDLSYRKFHRDYLQKYAPKYSNIISDTYYKNLRGGNIYYKIYNKLRHILQPKKYLKDYDLYTIDNDKFLNFEYLKKETYEELADILGISEKELKSMSYQEKTYLLNYENFFNDVKGVKI